MTDEGKNSFLQVLEGKAVVPVPVTPLYSGVPWFGPGYYLRSRFFDLVYRKVSESGQREMAVSPEDIMDMELQACDYVFREVMPLPATLSASYLQETKIPLKTISRSRIVLTDNGFLWRAEDGEELLKAEKEKDGGAWETPPLEEPARSGSWEDVGRGMQLLCSTVARLKAGEVKPLFTDWRAQYESGNFIVLEKLKERYGSDLLLHKWLNPPFPAAYVWLGEQYFTALLMALASDPEIVREFIEFFLPKEEENLEYLLKIGVEVIFYQEFITGAEIVNPAMYRDIVAPVTRRAFEFFKRLGFKVILYYCGDVIPLIEIVKEEIPFDGLAVEESRKGYSVDIAEVRNLLGRDIPLFGNVDIQFLEKASREEILNEAKRQIQAAGAGTPFILCTGSPQTFETTAENLRIFCESTRILAEAER